MTLTQTAAAVDSFAAMFEESLQRSNMRSGEVVSAEVVRIDYNFVVVNAGLKSEAYVPLEEFKNDLGEIEVQIGDFVSVAVDAVENGYGDTILSRDKAKRLASWLSLETALESGDFVTGTVSGKVKGGFTVDGQRNSRILAGFAGRCAPCASDPVFVRRQRSSSLRSSSSIVSATTWCCQSSRGGRNFEFSVEREQAR